MNRTRPARNLSLTSLEVLDDRIVLSATAASVAAQEALVLNRGGQALGAIYQEFANYQQAGSPGTFTSAQAGQVYLNGTSVGVDIRVSGDFNTLVSQLKSIGMQVTATSAQSGLVEGYLPISQLPTVASNSHEVGLSPIYKPVTRAATTGSSAQVGAVTAKGGQALGAIYQAYLDYQKGGSQGTFAPSQASSIYLSGTNVGVDLRFNGGDFNTLVTQLKGLGMQVTATSPSLGIVEGYLPIGQLPVIAGNSHLAGISPIYKPVTR